MRSLGSKLFISYQSVWSKSKVAQEICAMIERLCSCRALNFAVGWLVSKQTFNSPIWQPRWWIWGECVRNTSALLAKSNKLNWIRCCLKLKTGQSQSWLWYPLSQQDFCTVYLLCWQQGAVRVLLCVSVCRKEQQLWRDSVTAANEYGK